MSEINAHKVSVLGSLFQDNKVFEVPHYQRSYTWEEDLIQELWTDIRDVVLDDTNREHFIGAFIFSNSEEGERSSGPTRELIVDGQQRMTTLTILLRAMHDSLPKSDSYTAGTIFDHIIGGRFEKHPFERLILGEDVSDFFRKYIQDVNPESFRVRRGKRKVERRIVSAHQYFLKMIEEEARRRKLRISDFVNFLFTRLKQRLIAVRIKVDSDADAYAIFETINSKKVELSVSDLLKNYLYLQSNKVGSTALENTKKRWQEISDNLSQGGDEIEPSQFIRHYWISNVESVSEKNLYRAIKNHYAVAKSEFREFPSHLTDESSLYAKLLNATKDVGEEIIDEEAAHLLEQIKVLRVKQCYPLLLAAISVEIPKGQFKALLKAIIRVSILRGLTDRNPNELEDTYAKSARLLRKKNEKAVASIIKDILKFSIKEDEIKRYVLDNDISVQLARFILVQYELCQRTGELKMGTISIEHIMPRTPENLKDWGMSAEQHEHFVTQLGNLALVGTRLNQQASNRPYSEKRKVLAKSEIKTTSEIAREYEKWGEKEILERTSKLVDFTLSSWK